MRFLVALSSFALLAAAPAALASEPASTAPAAAAAKEKKICRIKRAPTGSNRRDGKSCKTEQEWRIYDGLEVEMSPVNAGTPLRSSSNGSED